MRRCPCAASFLLTEKKWVRFEAKQSTDAFLLHRVVEAFRKARDKQNTPWVPISRVSSFLCDDAREELSSLGGLAGYCREKQILKEERGDWPRGPLFYVKTVEGVLCVRMNSNTAHIQSGYKIPCKEAVQLPISRELLRILKRLPQKPVSLSACQRAWNLPTLEEAESSLWDMLREVESLVKPRTGRSVNISHYAQLGFLGGKLGFVSQGHVAARLLMQHCEGHGMSEDAEVPDWNEEEFSPQYDLWRMSRFLLTEDFTRIQHVLMQVGGIIQTPLLQVCMTYPERISLQLESAIGCNAGVEGRYYLNGVSLSEMHEVIGLKFLLSADEIAQHLKQTNSPLQRLTDDELRAERAKLKELPPLRRNKIRRSIVREEFRRRFPHGNVFLNPDVVAFHLYDMMSPGVWADNCYLREKLLPDGGKGSMHVGVDFFDMFPHLFITQGVTTTTVNVMRREQGMEDILGDGETWKSTPFREEDILFALLPWLMNKIDDFKDFKHLEFLLSFTPRHMFKRLQRNGSAVDLMANMLQNYPESFEVVSVNDGKGGSRWMVRVFRDGVEKLGTRLLNAAQTSQDESDKLAVGDATPVLDEEPSQEKVC